jgi:hypothetical protein
VIGHAGWQTAGTVVVVEANRSSRLKAQSRQALLHVTSEDEAAASLQARLALFSKVMFWSFLTLMAFLAGAYWKYQDIKPAHNDVVFGVGALGLAVMAFTWRFALIGKPLSITVLYRIDYLYAIGIGLVFALSAALSPDLPPATYTTLIYASFTVFMRAIVVPSSGRRTAVVSGLIFVQLVIAGIVLISTRTAAQEARDLPTAALILGGLVFGSSSVFAAVIGAIAVAVVLVDSLFGARGDEPPADPGDPARLTVDLRHRR